MGTIIEEFNEHGFAILYDLSEPTCIRILKQGCEVLVDELASALLAAGKISDAHVKHGWFVYMKIILTKPRLFSVQNCTVRDSSSCSPTFAFWNWRTIFLAQSFDSTQISSSER